MVIPENPSLEVRRDYELTYYVNNVNTENAQVLMEYGKRGELKNTYTYGLERISNGSDYYLYDGRGSVSSVITDTEELLASYTYDPFGSVTSGAPKFDSFYGYNGEETNPVIGRQYLRARYYDAKKGRFDVADNYLGSLTDPLTLNRYSYTMNNPVMRIDPSGHWPGWLDKAASTVKKGVNTVKNWVNDKVVKPTVNTVKSAAGWVNEKVVGPVKNVGASLKAGISAGSVAAGNASKKLQQTLSAAGKGLALTAGISGSVQLGAGRGSATYAQMKAMEAMQQVVQMQCESGETLDAYTENHNQEIYDYWSGFWDSLKKNLITEQILSMSATWEMFTQFNMDNTEELRRQFSINEYLKVMQTVDKEAYYSGRVDGDIASIIFGGVGMFAGTMTFLGGLGIGVGSGGLAVGVSIAAVIAGTVAAGYSGMIVFAAGRNLVGDWDKYQ